MINPFPGRTGTIIIQLRDGQMIRRGLSTKRHVFLGGDENCNRNGKRPRSSDRRNKAVNENDEE